MAEPEEMPFINQSLAAAPAQSPGSGTSLAESRLQAFQDSRQLLFSVAYRMLGSASDAEDILQEAFIRWQQSRVAEVDSPRAFLVTIVTRLCINYLQSARVKREQYV